MNNRITASEFKSKMGRYLKRVEVDDETIVITKNGKIIAKLVPAEEGDNISDLLALRGIIKDTGQTKQSVREERLRERYGITD